MKLCSWITNPPANESIANSADNLATISFDLGDNIEENENDPLKVLFKLLSLFVVLRLFLTLIIIIIEFPIFLARNIDLAISCLL